MGSTNQTWWVIMTKNIKDDRKLGNDVGQGVLERRDWE